MDTLSGGIGLGDLLLSAWPYFLLAGVIIFIAIKYLR